APALPPCAPTSCACGSLPWHTRSSRRCAASASPPDEWLLEVPVEDAAAFLERLSDLGARMPVSAVEVSDREVTLALSGPAVLDLLASGCPRDLARMAVGTGARTVFDTVQVVLTREAEDRFHMTVWRSFAPHVRALLDLAAREIAAGF
ncbi:sarcosine oxidase subunit gamma, partial [Amaricoccus sp. HAR-UPW-R2A-40]